MKLNKPLVVTHLMEVHNLNNCVICITGDSMMFYWSGNNGRYDDLKPYVTEAQSKKAAWEAIHKADKLKFFDSDEHRTTVINSAPFDMDKEPHPPLMRTNSELVSAVAILILLLVLTWVVS